MRLKQTIALIIVIFINVSSFLAFWHSVKAITAPTVTFSGDDLLQNGGTDDSYDALVVLDITTGQANPTSWEIQYSNNGGQSWNNVLANYTSLASNHRKYYFSTSKIYAPTLLIRVRAQEAGQEWSDYWQGSVSLTHRATNHGAHYFVESFNDAAFQGATTRLIWDTNRALVELGPNPPDSYHPNGRVQSTDLLSDIANNNVLSAAFQPVQWNFGKTLEYQLSNNGTDWYGDTSGTSRNNVWFSFPGQTVPTAVTVPFNDSTSDGLYWRANLTTNDTSVTPQIYQLRFQWQENSAPQACFTVSPASSSNPGQVFSFNANCSSDYEEGIGTLDFRWDWENDASFDINWETGFAGYIKTHIYNSTSTFTINLEVRDSYGATDSFLNSINEAGVEGSVSGWLWSSNYGWTSLNCDNTYYGSPINYCPPNYGWQMNADYTMQGWAWDYNLGWLCLGSTCQPYGQTPDASDPLAVYSRATGEVTGWGRYLVFGGNGWLKLRGNWCGLGEDQCVHLNLSRRALNGWGWSGGLENGVPVGVGWVQFEGSLNVPWLETKYGSIYGRGDVGSTETMAAPEGRYNASYCILASGNIINLTSEINCLEASYRDLGLPNVSERYRTILGLIDFERILDGQETTYASGDVDANLPRTLAGQVYHFSSAGVNDFIIDSPLTFYNARNFNSSGAGTIVIDGNLHINSNLYYEGAAVSGQIENLASVSWIVKGDVIIDPLLSNLVGAFIVLGQEGAVCPQAGCGYFKTGDDSGNPRQLVVGGLAMARQFTFERSYKEVGEPAEKIISDGRVLVNTPPGLEDVAKGLPIWREAYATTEIE